MRSPRRSPLSLRAVETGIAEDLVDDDGDRVRADINAPAQAFHRVEHDALPGMALLHRVRNAQ